VCNVGQTAISTFYDNAVGSLSSCVAFSSLEHYCFGEMQPAVSI